LHQQAFSARSKRPWLALLLGLCPGLVALDNGQTLRALFHVTLIIILSTIADQLPPSLQQLMTNCATAAYLYSLLGAFSQAREIRRGADPHVGDEQIEHLPGAHTRAIGVVLPCLALLATLGRLLPTQRDQHLALLLIPAGICLRLRRRQ
jgi:hypothetical protein